MSDFFGFDLFEKWRWWYHDVVLVNVL